MDSEASGPSPPLVEARMVQSYSVVGKNSSIVIFSAVPFTTMSKSSPLSLVQASVYDVKGSSTSSAGGPHLKVNDVPFTLTKKFCGSPVGTLK